MAKSDRIDQFHLSPTLELAKHHPVLKFFVRSFSKGDMQLRLKNDSVYGWNYPGAQGVVASADRFQSMRSTRLVFDEAQQFHEAMIAEAEPTQLVDPHDPEAQREVGASIRFLGVSDGNRDSPFFRYDQGKTDTFIKPRLIRGKSVPVDFRWRLPSIAMPYYTPAIHAQALARGQCDPARGYYSEQYKQNVLGLHGRNAERMFPARLREPCCQQMDDWHHLYLMWRTFIDSSVFDPLGNYQSTDFSFMEGHLPDVDGAVYGIGIDVGTTELSCVCGWLLQRSGRWRWQWMVTMAGWRDTTHQVATIDYLCHRYPVKFIGIDNQGPGIGLVSQLRSDKRCDLDYHNLVKPFDSGRNMVVGLKAGSHVKIADASSSDLERQLMHPWSMQHFRDCLANKTLVLPHPNQAPEIHAELDAVGRSFNRAASGKITWKFTPPHPHFVSSIQCYLAAKKTYELELEGVESAEERTQTMDREMFFGAVDPVLYL